MQDPYEDGISTPNPRIPSWTNQKGAANSLIGYIDDYNQSITSNPDQTDNSIPSGAAATAKNQHQPKGPPTSVSKNTDQITNANSDQVHYGKRRSNEFLVAESKNPATAEDLPTENMWLKRQLNMANDTIHSLASGICLEQARTIRNLSGERTRSLSPDTSMGSGTPYSESLSESGEQDHPLPRVLRKTTTRISGYLCPVKDCGNLCKTPEDVQRHSKCHQSPGTYPCFICGKPLDHSNSRNRHVKDFHKGWQTTERTTWNLEM